MVTRFLLAALFIGSAVASAQVEENGWEFWAEAIEHLQPSDGESPPLLSSDEEAMLLAYLDAPMRPPSSNEQVLLDRIAPTLALIQQASACAMYDSGVDFSGGFSTMLPHLAPMRNGARLLAVQARASAAMGDLDGAARWLGVLGAVSTQPGSDRIAISSLVGASIFTYANEQLEQFIGSGLINRERATAMLEQLGTLRVDDPFDFAGAIDREGEILLNFFDALQAGDSSDELAMLGDMGLGDEAMQPEDLAMQRGLAEEIFGELSEAFRDPDRERGRATLEAISFELKELPPNAALLKLLAPSLTRLFDKRDEVEAKLLDRLRQLESVAAGRIKPEALQNAAIIWLDAGKRATELAMDDQAAARAILAQAITMGGAYSNALAQWMAATNSTAQPLVIAGLDAAAIPAADFHAVLRERRPFVEAKYLGDLRAIGRVLLASAHMRRESWATGTPSDLLDTQALLAAEEIAAVIQLISHLSLDASIAHSVLATALFHSSTDQIDAFVAAIVAKEKRKQVDPEIGRAVLSRLRAAVDHLPRRDPFGLRTATANDRLEALNRYWRSEQEFRSSQPGNDLPEVLHDLSPNRIASLIVLGNGRRLIESDPSDRVESQHLADTTDLYPFVPTINGDAPAAEETDQMAAFKAVAEQIRARPSNARSAIRRLNLRTLIDIEQRVREAYARIADTDKTLRP